MILTGHPVDLVERKMLMIECLAIGVLQLLEQIGGGGLRGDTGPNRHRVDQQSDHRVGAEDLGRPPGHGRAKGDVALTGHYHQQLSEGALQHRADGGMTCSCQLAECASDLLGQRK